ncbi:MAG: glutamate--tRNA ligase [Nitrospiraceae bacterium]|nr:glutamate--tRNA ligase [Nitrospiraceae bacterium]
MPLPKDSSIRVRFAPSPTGHLHLGGARTALFNFLLARHYKGTLVLRIEDTDRERSTQESIAAILDGLSWLDLGWDEGPFYQTERLDRYRELAHDLLAKGSAYRCDCTQERLESRREEALKKGLPPRYDGRCRDRSVDPSSPHVIRFRTPDNLAIVFDDLIRGTLSFDSGVLDDLIILRTDGMPTYNFAVVVDDIDMKITHVIRGDDHINNTPRQIPIFQALGAPLPDFAHLPMIYGPDRTRLSKRHGATSVMAYRDMGFLPQALVNYLVRLGWSHKDQEIFTREELVQYFDLDHVGSSPSVFNPEKFLWLNAHYLKNSPGEELVPLLREQLPPLTSPLPQSQDPAHWVRVADELKGRSKTLVELAQFAHPFLEHSRTIDPEARKKILTPGNGAVLEQISLALRSLSHWTGESLRNAFSQVGEALHLKLGELAQPVRVAVTGRTVSPGIFEVLLLAGREVSLARIDEAVRLSQEPVSDIQESQTGKEDLHD